MYKLSPSSVGFLRECPRCLWLYANDNISRPFGVFPSLPSGMDRVLKVYFDKYRVNGELPREIVGKVKEYGIDANHLVPLVNLIQRNGDRARAHELLHCFDVGFGAAELVQHIANDPQAQEKLGILPGSLNEDHIRAALLAGLGHDIILSFRGSTIETTTPESLLEALVTPEAAAKFKGNAQYLKDVIGDDLRGAIVIDTYSTSFPESVRVLAVNSLLNGSDLPTIGKETNLWSKFNPYKVLDALWYNDGNYPIRGHAEADMLVGDRLSLFNRQKVNADIVVAGVKKLLGYTEQDLQQLDFPNGPSDTDPSTMAIWQLRGIPVKSWGVSTYLKNIVAKKAGAFLDTIEGTQTYDFVVYDLASRGRGECAVRSPAFWAGVDKMPKIIGNLQESGVCGGPFETIKDIETLSRRYEEVQQYRPKGDVK